jgi:hypothetical protein
VRMPAATVTMDAGCEMPLMVAAQVALSGRYIEREYNNGLSSHKTVASTPMLLASIRQSCTLPAAANGTHR